VKGDEQAPLPEFVDAKELSTATPEAVAAGGIRLENASGWGDT